MFSECDNVADSLMPSNEKSHESDRPNHLGFGVKAGMAHIRVSQPDKALTRLGNFELLDGVRFGTLNVPAYTGTIQAFCVEGMRIDMMAKD